MKHTAAPQFWVLYGALPEEVRSQADRAFALLKQNPFHPSLHFKRLGSYWSARVGISYRALGKQTNEGVLWVWIGHHSEYDRLVVQS